MAGTKPKKTAKKTTKKVAKKTTTTKKKVAKKAPKKTTKKVTKKVAKKAVKKTTKKPVAKKATKKSSKKTTKKTAAKKVAPKAVKKTTKKPVKWRKDQELKAAELMKMGRARGYVTYDEILKYFPTIEKEVPFLEELYERFSIANIDVLSSGGMLGEDPSEELLAQKNSYRRSDSGYDSIQMYLREIGQYPLLTAQEEKTLAKRIVDGDDEARNLLARANLRLVVSIA
ncbi:hypothetical protein KC722_02220, partial [Candidatus Kaiserbacteria bacterium]|nr:hypothetical protein [Candidatus Kaiserbacteria bacterium]